MTVGQQRAPDTDAKKFQTGNSAPTQIIERERKRDDQEGGTGNEDRDFSQFRHFIRFLLQAFACFALFGVASPPSGNVDGKSHHVPQATCSGRDHHKPVETERDSRTGR